jgi:N-acetylglucosaminyl-diphospho-decaprenol L-rhamnosyltransferase
MPPENPSVTSVIMVSYHTGPVLFQAIASVLGQTRPVQLCLVDNGNLPDIMAKLRSMAEGDRRIHFISGHGNVGFSKGCNLGARAAEGGHLLFLNPDSKLPPDTVEKLQRHAAALRPPFMIGARLLDEDGRDQRGCRRALLTPMTAFIEATHLHFLFPRARLNFNGEPVPPALAPIPAISGAFMFLPREDFLNIGSFDEGYFLHVEDLDLCLRFRRAGGEIYFAPDIPVIHVGATSNVTNAFIEKHKARGFIRYFHKNFGDRYPLPFLWLVDVAVCGRAWVKIGLAVTKRTN